MQGENYISDTKIAVVVPVYNAGNKLRPCIQSISNQTLREIVIVLVNDGSTDNSGKVCDEFSKKDSRIVVIHQKNQGSVKARYAGVHSRRAQQAKYIALCDADDLLPKDALKRMYEEAEEKQADCICGQMKKIYKGVKIPQKWIPECFKIHSAKEYNHEAIMKELYQGCFGISNYPVNLWAKIYKTKLISEAINFEPYVKFMGEDLSVTLRVMPQINKLVIIPDVVYLYRIGGGTSRFMPYMMDDFLALYREKERLIHYYEMPEETKKLINIELMNIVSSHLRMCRDLGKYVDEKLMKEIKRISEIPEIVSAASELMINRSTHVMAKWIFGKEYTRIKENIEKEYCKSWKRRMLKKLLKI